MKDLQPMSILKEDIEQVVKRYHQPLHELLPKVQKLLDRIQRRHKKPLDHQKKFVQIMAVVVAELSAHLYKEEETLFPMIEDYFQEKNEEEKINLAKTLIKLNEVMIAEHNGLDFLLKEVNIYAQKSKDDNDDFNKLARALFLIEENIKEHSSFEDDKIFAQVTDMCLLCT